MTRRAVLGAVCLVLAAATLASAQEYPMRIAELQQRQREGTFTSHSVVVPAPTAGVGANPRIKITAVLNVADLTDPAFTMRLVMEESRDNGQTWLHVTGIGYTGGQYYDPDTNAPNPLPFVIMDWPEFVGRRVRFVLDLSRRVNIGGLVEVY